MLKYICYSLHLSLDAQCVWLWPVIRSIFRVGVCFAPYCISISHIAHWQYSTACSLTFKGIDSTHLYLLCFQELDEKINDSAVNITIYQAQRLYSDLLEDCHHHEDNRPQVPAHNLSYLNFVFVQIKQQDMT